MSILLGCIADDVTGATDLANALACGGLRTVLHIGVPEDTASPAGADAVVVALKTRTVPPREAVRASRAALEGLLAAGARQLYFKYCSTFDSTEEGNIGPVLEALLEALGERFTVACPVFPANGRTLYQGHLFVGDVLLSESGMRHHPLTPMTDANLVRVLGRQMKGPVGLIPYEVVRRGAAAVRAALQEGERRGTRCMLIDALSERDLRVAAAACAHLKLLTGGSGLAAGLPENFRAQGLLASSGSSAADLPQPGGPAAVLAGSCSPATRAQVAALERACPAFCVDPLRLEHEDVVAEALDWASARLASGPVLIYSSAPPGAVASIQARIGRDRAGILVEQAMARIAQALVDLGVRRLIVAGGETAGAVLSALRVRTLRIGPEITPGVPWVLSDARRPTLCLALKSGNFGSDDFFTQALGMFR